jgi:hypothetical protein
MNKTAKRPTVWLSALALLPDTPLAAAKEVKG